MYHHVIIKKNVYYDSFSLMKISAEIKTLHGIYDAVVCMATDQNREFLYQNKFPSSEIQNSTNNDLILAIKALDEESAVNAVKEAELLLHQREKMRIKANRPRTLESAMKRLTDASVVLISTPGKYVFREAHFAITKGLHVMIFSDKVPIEDEVRLKQVGDREGLLVMGPDCGTSIINGAFLGFANRVRRGPIGIVGASGTGIQEVSVILDRLGVGVSHAIGTGGRDLSGEVGGITSKMGIKALARDPETKLIILIAKSFNTGVISEVLSLLRESGKPSVTHLIGGVSGFIEKMGMVAAETLEDTALKASGYFMENSECALPSIDKELSRVIEYEVRNFSVRQKYLRGLFCGGTLCAEAAMIFSRKGTKIHSNMKLNYVNQLPNAEISIGHTVVDLGDDFFTQGRAHPMIDPRIRIDRFITEAIDPETAVILLDVILGYGASLDMAGDLLPAIIEGKRIHKELGGCLSVIVNLCGTESDVQDYREQKKKLEESGVIVLPSNALATQVAANIIQRLS